MSIKAPQVLVFVVCAATMVAVLSVVRFTFFVQADNEFWENLSGAGEEVAEMRAKEAETLSQGGMPIDKAMQHLASRGRVGLEKIRPKTGAGMAPLAGWVHHPDFNARVRRAKAVQEEILAAEEPDAGVADADAAVEPVAH